MTAKTRPASAQEIESHPIQAFSELASASIALPQHTRAQGVESLNQLLADTLALRDLYKKSHWQTSGITFMQLHLVFDKHAAEQAELADAIAERVQLLGGVSLAAPHDVAETTLLPRPPRDRQAPEGQLARLLHGHEIVLEEARAMARAAAASGDDGTNDLIVSQVILTNEFQSWVARQHMHGASNAGSSPR